MTLENKAVLIERQTQDRKLRNICRSLGYTVAPATNYKCPYYYMAVLSNNCGNQEVFLIPNSDLESERGSVSDRGYVIISIRQFEEIVNNTPRDNIDLKGGDLK